MEQQERHGATLELASDELRALLVGAGALGGGSMANLTALLIALRAYAEPDADRRLLTAYASEEVHFSVAKAATVLGIRLRRVDLDCRPGDRRPGTPARRQHARGHRGAVPLRDRPSRCGGCRSRGTPAAHSRPAETRGRWDRSARLLPAAGARRGARGGRGAGAGGIADPALHDIARIVHDAELEDERFDAPEARGLDVILRGLSLVAESDEQMLELSAPIYDGLYEDRRRATMLGREPG